MAALMFSSHTLQLGEAYLITVLRPRRSDVDLLFGEAFLLAPGLEPPLGPLQAKKLRFGEPGIIPRPAEVENLDLASIAVAWAEAELAAGLLAWAAARNAVLATVARPTLVRVEIETTLLQLRARRWGGDALPRVGEYTKDADLHRMLAALHDTPAVVLTELR